MLALPQSGRQGKAAAELGGASQASFYLERVTGLSAPWTAPRIGFPLGVLG